jgi:hypothetical protein
VKKSKENDERWKPYFTLHAIVLYDPKTFDVIFYDVDYFKNKVVKTFYFSKEANKKRKKKGN